MNKPKETETATKKAPPDDGRPAIRTARLLFTAVTTLGAAVVTSAIAGPKLPPYEGD